MRLPDSTLRAWLCIARLTPVLCAAAVLAASSASAGDLHPEFGLGVNGFLGLGELATVSEFGYGGDAALDLVREGGGLGLRAGAGLQILQGHQLGTGQDVITPGGTQGSSFKGNQHFLWLAVGPEWSKPVGGGRFDYYLMVGKASVNAKSSGTYGNVLGPDPGTTHTYLMIAGAIWSFPGSKYDLGVELFATGSAEIWDDPPIVSDGAGNFATRGHTASITGIAVRWGRHFGRGASEGL